MIVYGRPLAAKMLNESHNIIVRHKIAPKLVIIRAGEDPSSEIYIKYKIKAAEKIGVTIDVIRYFEDQKDECITKLREANDDNNVHGTIVQLPLFRSWDQNEIIGHINLKKDVDGFLEDSPYIPATAEGTWVMLQEFAYLEGFTSLKDFLCNKQIVVLGKGKTAGKPIRDLLSKNQILSKLIDSKTTDPNTIIQSADIIISATGKKNILNKGNVKSGAYVIGVGVSKEIENGEEKTVGDVNEDEIAEIAKMYCPTIGGIGPLTIACLLKNVVHSATSST